MRVGLGSPTEKLLGLSIPRPEIAAGPYGGTVNGETLDRPEGDRQLLGVVALLGADDDAVRVDRHPYPRPSAGAVSGRRGQLDVPKEVVSLGQVEPRRLLRDPFGDPGSPGMVALAEDPPLTAPLAAMPAVARGRADPGTGRASNEERQPLAMLALDASRIGRHVPPGAAIRAVEGDGRVHALGWYRRGAACLAGLQLVTTSL